jgi:hypothetical protein
MSLDTFDLAALPNTGDGNDIVQAFAANPAFRAAEMAELTTPDDPYRRPVRPDDLAWLDYTEPMPASKALKLSALLGHRMLRNIYDADHLYLPPRRNEAADADAAAFYSVRNRVLGQLARPILERHLFTVLEEAREPLCRNDLAGLVDEVRQYCQQRFSQRPAFAAAALSTKDRKAAATFVLLQFSAFRPATHAAVARAALGEYDLAHPRLRGVLLDDYRGWTEAAGAYRDLLASAGLVPGAAAYWQLYLGSSLGRGNHLHHLGTNQENVFALLGALVHEKIDRAAGAGHFEEIFADGLGYSGRFFAAEGALTEAGAAELTENLLGPLHDRFGIAAVEGFHRGFAGARWFARLWDDDLATQLSWADRIPEHQEKAEKIDQYLTNENIEVDLDTFVESHEETSTTHVHDEHRLVMIEKGQMHFWHNVTHKIALNEGDKLLIPVSRLHGSTVLSGSCTYHQPIIPDELLRQFG